MNFGGTVGLSPRRAPGFSLVELIIILVLLGITGFLILPRFLESDAFSESAARDGLISTIRAAQQAALGRSTVTFEIDKDSDNWLLTAKAGIGGTVIRNFDIPVEDITLTTGSTVDSEDTCATESGDFENVVTSNFVLSFDAKGDVASFSNGGPGFPENIGPQFNGVRICVNNTIELSVCVSPAGYAYAGNCDE